MPIYEYECLENGHQFEVQQKMADKPLESCKVCNGPARRLVSSTNFVLKGGGWYAHGYHQASGSSGDYKEKAPTTPSTEKKNQKDGNPSPPTPSEKPKSDKNS
jgi:putative FmdB family regulatory protein